MPFAEQLTQINAEYFALRRKALNHPHIHPQGASGIRRDRVQALANRLIRNRKHAVGVMPK